MLPILYESNTTDFNNNGLGFVRNCTKCKAVEVRNGLYELELEMLTNDRLADNIAVSKFLKAPPNPHDDPQIFEIYQMSAGDTKITAKAQHLKYIAFGNVTDDLYNSPIARTPSEHWTAVENLLALRPNYFTFSSDISVCIIFELFELFMNSIRFSLHSRIFNSSSSLSCNSIINFDSFNLLIKL